MDRAGDGTKPEKARGELAQLVQQLFGVRFCVVAKPDGMTRLRPAHLDTREALI